VNNYIFSYDLNGKTPTHAEMDTHISQLPGAVRGRILETVWYIRYGGTMAQLAEYLALKFSDNDLYILVDASRAVCSNQLLVDVSQFLNTWNKAA
jgi:hypothetical protein